MKRVTMLAALVGLLLAAAGRAEDPTPLVLEAKIPLGAVSGRIDHFAFDPDRQLLFVAELGNDSVGVVDLKERKVLRRHRRTERAAGSCLSCGDQHALCRQRRRRIGASLPGSRLLASRPHRRSATMPTTSASTHGATESSSATARAALAVIDPASRRKIADMPLKGHPESFQFDETGSRIFVNVPDARQIAVVDAGSGQQISTLDTAGARSNFPMAVDADEHRLLVAFRSPAKLDGLRNRDRQTGGEVSTPAAMPTTCSSMPGGGAST